MPTQKNGGSITLHGINAKQFIAHAMNQKPAPTPAPSEDRIRELEERVCFLEAERDEARLFRDNALAMRDEAQRRSKQGRASAGRKIGLLKEIILAVAAGRIDAGEALTRMEQALKTKEAPDVDV